MEKNNLTHSSMPLPENYPHEWLEQVELRNGTQVLLRPIRPDDAPRLQAGFRRLSPRSIYLRFLEAYKELPEKQARRFAELDYRTQMALVAEIQEAGQPQLIGVARYALVNVNDPLVAESAIVVVDEYQRHGLGAILMDRLVRYARNQGVDYFLATVHHTNAQIIHFIEHSGLATSRQMIEPGVWEVRVSLKSDGAC
jgi:acetyltransferase